MKLTKNEVTANNICWLKSHLPKLDYMDYIISISFLNNSNAVAIMIKNAQKLT